MKGTQYNSLIPSKERGNLVEPLVPCIGDLTMIEFETIVRDICRFTGQVLPDLDALDKSFNRINDGLLNRTLDVLEEDFYLNIAENLRCSRQELKLTQRDLAELLQVSMHVYRQIENTSTPCKFQSTISPRWWIATGIHPVHITRNSNYHLFRHHQTLKIQIMKQVLSNLKTSCANEIVDFIKATATLRRTLSTTNSVLSSD